MKKNHYRIHFKNNVGAIQTGWQKATSKTSASNEFLENTSMAISIKGIYRVNSKLYYGTTSN